MKPARRIGNVVVEPNEKMPNLRDGMVDKAVKRFNADARVRAIKTLRRRAPMVGKRKGR